MVTRATEDTDEAASIRDVLKYPGIISAAELKTKDFADPRWAVPGVIPEGCTLLVGAPKRGKSWLLLGIGIAIATGNAALGKLSVKQGDVLLLCLEDNQRRLQERIDILLGVNPAPARLHLATEWPRIGEGGAERLDQWLTEHPDTRLVGVDVLARMRQASSGQGNQYQADYEALSALKTVADKHGVALVVVHHTRKSDAEDPFDTISGTQGLAGAADTSLVLKFEHGRSDAVLHVRGRDVAEESHALGFDKLACQWTILGDAAEYQMQAGRAEIDTLLRESGPLSPKEIAEALGAKGGTIRSRLNRMYNAGQVIERNGMYYCHDYVFPPVAGSDPETPATTATGATGPITGPKTLLHPALHPLQQVQQHESNGQLEPIQLPQSNISNGYILKSRPA